MKHYKQILEAINRGIQFALDDFEPEEVQLSKPKQETITKEDSLYNTVKLKELTVDLGLPSGTLWFKYNIGVDPDNQEYFLQSNWYGKYYSWGEIMPLPRGKLYSWENYKFCKGKENSLTKYCSIKAYGYDMEQETDSFLSCYTDNLNILQPKDDIATQIYGKGYHIPTKEQWEELIRNTELKYGYWGVNNSRGKAFILISKINGNELYIPTSGYNNDLGLNGVGRSACLWSSTLCEYKPSSAYRQAFRLDSNNQSSENMSISARSGGFVIRPVYN